MSGQRPLAVIISPQPWVGFQVSKHHYARALAAAGWRVVFVDPPSTLGRPGAVFLQDTEVPNIRSLQYRPLLPYRLKFHARPVFDAAMRQQARIIRRHLGRPDLLWDFDNAYQFRDLRPFGARRTLFHLVDDVGALGQGNKHADHVFALHPAFWEHAEISFQEDHVIGHGLGALHMQEARNPPQLRDPDKVPRLGFVGNLGADWIDWDAVAEMLRRHPRARFTFWGPLPEPARRGSVLNWVCAAANTEFRGLAAPETVLLEGRDVDVWLLPFRSSAFRNGRPLDSHKVLEYLATGKAVAMSWLEAYAGSPLVDISSSRQMHDLPDRLDWLLANIDLANAADRQQSRKAYALERGYDQHLERILTLVHMSGESGYPFRPPPKSCPGGTA